MHRFPWNRLIAVLATLTVCLHIHSAAASSRANIPERCFTNSELYSKQRKAISNCSSQCIQTIKSDSITKIDISVAYCKISKNDPQTKGCLYCVCDTAHSFQASNNRTECVNDFRNDKYLYFFNFGLFIPMYIITFVKAYKLQREKVAANLVLRKKARTTSRLYRLSESGTARCIGNRAIASLNCLLIYLVTKIVVCVLCGPGNMFYLVPTLLYVSVYESGLKFLMISTVYIITAWAKVNAKMNTSSRIYQKFSHYLPSFLTIPVISDIIIAIVFISWIIHPVLRWMDKEYFLFANLCDVIFVILGGLSAIIFGTELAKTLRKMSQQMKRSTSSAGKQVDLAKAISWGIIGIGLYSIFVIVFFALNFVSDSNIRQIHDVTDRSYVHLCIFKILNLFLVYCLLQVFAGKPIFKVADYCSVSKKYSCGICFCLVSPCCRQNSPMDSESKIDIESVDAVGTASSIAQDDSIKNANSWVKFEHTDGSKRKPGGEGSAVKDFKLVERRSLLE